MRKLTVAALAIAGIMAIARWAGAPTDNLAALNGQIIQLNEAGNYAEAITIAQRALLLTERLHSPNHPKVGMALNNLAALHQLQGRYAEAEPLYQRSLAILENALSSGDPDATTSLDNLSWLYRQQGRHAEAEPLFKRSLAIREKALGPDHPDVGSSLNNLAGVYRHQGRHAEAEPLFKRSLAIREKSLDPDQPDVGTSLSNLAALYRQQGRYAEAEPLLKRSLAIREKALGTDRPRLVASLNDLAALYLSQGRYAEAEPLSKRALAISEQALGLDHPEVGTSLNNLAELYRQQGRYDEAEPLLKRSVAIGEQALDPDDSDVGTSLNNLAALYQSQGRYAEAEPLFKRSLVVSEKALGPDDPQVGTSLNNLATLYGSQGRHAEAEPLLKRSLAIREQLGPDHPDLGTSLSNLASLYALQGRYVEAERLEKRAFAIREGALGPDHPDVSTSLNNLAGLHLAQGEWGRAVDYLQRGTGLMVRRAIKGAETVGRALTGKADSEISRESVGLWMLVKAAHRWAGAEAWRAPELARAMFETAQWALVSEAANSLVKMAARYGKGYTPLSRLVRERQDLVGEWQARDKLLITAVSQPPSTRNAQAEQEQRTRLATIDARVAEIDRALTKDFPDYAALASPKPLSLADVQSQLGMGEALVVFLDTPEYLSTTEETFVWVVTKTGWRWARSDLGTKALTDKVAALRRGLDPTEGGARAATRLGDDGTGGFDLGLAHELYEVLLGPAADLIGDKRHLMVVSSGPLTGLPFHILVTEKPAPGSADAYRTAQWLARRHAISTLPSVASLGVLRRTATAGAAAKPFIGFADPVFNRTALTTASLPQKAGAERGVSAYFRGGRADAGALGMLRSLPETADEVRAIAGTLDAGAELRIGRAAAESEVKRLPLDQFRIVHFATHGLVAGEIANLAEPALALSAPEQSSDDDDGLLTASEVAALKLNAEWVVLSACNTAAGDKPGAEALSGLARAFFYAGSRALLVSHWPVQSEAAVRLTTATFSELKRAPEIGRAEALRRSMLAMIDAGGAGTHPSSWAPFVVVGEGAW